MDLRRTVDIECTLALQDSLCIKDTPESEWSCPTRFAQLIRFGLYGQMRSKKQRNLFTEKSLNNWGNQPFGYPLKLTEEKKVNEPCQICGCLSNLDGQELPQSLLIEIAEGKKAFVLYSLISHQIFDIFTYPRT